MYLPEDKNKCNEFNKSKDNRKKAYIYESDGNKLVQKGNYKYCCNSSECDCKSKDDYYYSRISSVIILDDKEKTNRLKNQSLSSILNSHYVISPGIYGYTDGNSVDINYINMSGNIGNVYKADNKYYLFNNFLNKRNDILKGNEREFSWRIYNLSSGILAHEDTSSKNFTHKKTSKGKKMWTIDYEKRRQYIPYELKESLPKSLMTVPKMVKWKEIIKTSTEETIKEKYPIFRFIIDTNISYLLLDGFKKNIEINGKYIRVNPLYPYMDGTVGPVFKKIDAPFYLWYIPFMDKNVHIRSWSKKVESSIVCCYCIQKIKEINGIQEWQRNFSFSHDTGINGMRGEFIPKTGIWSEYDLNNKVHINNINVEYGGMTESFVGKIYETFTNNNNIEHFNNNNLLEHYDGLNITNNNNLLEHYDGLYLENELNNIEYFKTKDKIKNQVGNECIENGDCITGICDVKGEYSCKNRCVRDRRILDKTKPSAYNCPNNFKELDNYYNIQLKNKQEQIITISKNANFKKNEINNKLKKYKNGFYKNIKKDIDDDLNKLNKIYEPDSSNDLGEIDKSIIQNYFNTLVDFYKEQSKSYVVDNNTINIGDNIVDNNENQIDNNSDALIELDNDLDTVKRQSSISFDSILKRDTFEEFLKLLVIYLLLTVFFIILERKKLLLTSNKRYCLFFITIIFAGILFFKFNRSKNRSGHNYQNKEFESGKIINKKDTKE